MYKVEEKSNNIFMKNCKAYVQVLPSDNINWEYVKILNDKKTIYVRSTQDFGKGRNVIFPNYWTFPTDGTLYNSNQKDIYNTVTENLLESVLNGNNFVIVGYGQTGTGKSLTISGVHNLYENRGIIPRLMTDLFKLKERYKNEQDIEYSMSFVEITRTHFVDLLLDYQNRFQNFEKTTATKITSVNHGLELLFQGEGRRLIFYNSPHISHCASSVLKIFVKCNSLVHSDPTVTYSEICVVDMAGCDNCGNISCNWKKCRETGIGNLAKTQLEQFLLTLKSKSQTKKIDKTKGYLVQYLSEVLKPQSIIRFIGHIRTNKEDILITLSILRFAQLARDIKPAKLISCVKKSEELETENMKVDYEYLQKQIELDAMLRNNDISYNINEFRAMQMKNTLNEYIVNKNAEITILNVTDTILALKTFKELYNNLEMEYLDRLKYIEEQIITSSRGSFSLKERSSHTQRTSQTQHGSRKKKSSDKGSLVIKDNKSILKGHLDNSGISIGRATASSFQGSVMKSKKKMASKTKIKVKKHRKSSETKSTIETDRNFENFSSMSNETFDLKMKLPNYDDAWKAYIVDDEYDYVNLNELLNSYDAECRNCFKEYNELYKSIQEITNSIDIRKEDLLRVQMHKEKPIIQCSEETESLLLQAETKIETFLITLITDLDEKREKFLTVQADLKINIDHYHRIKKNILDDFTKYCSDKYNIQLTDSEQTKCIEDTLSVSISSMKDDKMTEESEKKIFYKLQKQMRKIIENMRKEKLNTYK